MAPSDADDFEQHEWKSEFASSRSGRNSPNIFAKFRRKLLLTPPVRCARSPRLTDEELDALTGDLPYETNYTYAYSKIYDPSLPDHWEVPNLTGGPSPRYLAEQEHWSAASLGRQLFYALRFPVVLLIHVISYILEAFYHVVKISTFTVWDFLLYLIRTAKYRYEAWLDHRRRTALIRNRQDPFKVKAARFIRTVFETITWLFLAPIQYLAGKKTGVEQYDYKSIKNQLESERASRMVTRSQTLERSRKFEGLSQSPSRRAVPKQSVLTTITAKVFSSGGNGATPTTSTIKTRTVRERSVTPRFRTTRSTRQAEQAFEEEASPEVAVDTPLSTYGLRSRGLSHLNTPEPTFDIGQAAATSTPLFRNTFGGASDETTFFSKATGATSSAASAVFNFSKYIAQTLLLIVLFPFYTVVDYGKSAYMKWTDAKITPMEPVHVRDVDEPVETEAEAMAIHGTVSWPRKVLGFFGLVATLIKDIAYGFVAIVLGTFQEIATAVITLPQTIVSAAKSLRTRSWCNLLGLILALLLLFFVFGFMRSEDTKIRSANDAQELAANPIDSFPKQLQRNVVNFAKLVWEYIIDLAFAAYNVLKSLGAKTGHVYGILLSSAREALNSIWNSVLWLVFGGYDNGKNAIFWTKDTVHHAGTSVVAWFGGLFASAPDTGAFDESTEQRMREVYEEVKEPKIANGPSFFEKLYADIDVFATSCFDSARDTTNNAVKTLRVIPDTVSSFFINIADYLNNVIYGYIWKPISTSYKKFDYVQFTRPLVNAARYLWSLILLGTETVVFALGKAVSTALWLLMWPFGMMTRAWIHISNYAPEEVIQVIPIPQAVTPDPILDTLQKKIELEDEELKIHPAPAPAPIPIPHEPPVVIHQTNIVETVDKEAIIKEVTEKLRAELSAQFQQEMHQELSAKFEQNYNTLIEKLKVENTNIQIDNHHLEALIRQMIYEYDTDKTGQVDYALESSGGAVVSTRCSETYKSYTRLEKFWDIPIYYHHYSPRVVIQRNSKSLFPGECWCFKESRGYIAVELSHFIDVSSISYEHIGKEVAPEGNRSSAPKGVLVWAYKQIDDLNSRVLIGDYTYNLDGPPLQFFIAKHKPDFPVKFVELEVTSNYGAQFTCLYRLRVHGKMIKL